MGHFHAVYERSENCRVKLLHETAACKGSRGGWRKGSAKDRREHPHERLRDKNERHKESKDPEPLALSAQGSGELLGDSGVEQERVAAFREQCQEQFGGSAALNPENSIAARRFEVKTPDATVNLDPERSCLVETRSIDGRKHILIPADEGVEVNGMAVEILSGTE